MEMVHRLVGLVVVSVFTVGWVWGVWSLLRRRPPGERFWSWLAVAQVVAGIQSILGIVLLISGRSADLLHYVYGFGPLLVLVAAHVVAREGQRSSGARTLQPWAAFAAAAFVCFGLSLRAFMTGLGMA